MFTPEVVSQIVSTHTGFSPSGISCKFIKLDNKWGVKVYHNRVTRDHAYQMQTAMYCHNYAPEVGISFDVGENYCYLTEIAKPFHNKVEGETYQQDNRRYNNTPFLNEKKAEIKELVRQMQDVGYYNEDSHLGNFGVLNGNVVCIDFGDFVE